MSPRAWDGTAVRSALALTGLEKLDGGRGVFGDITPGLSIAIAESTSSERAVVELLARMGRASRALEWQVYGARLLGQVLAEIAHDGDGGDRTPDASGLSVPTLTLILGLDRPASPRDDGHLVRHLLGAAFGDHRGSGRVSITVDDAQALVRMARSVPDEHRFEIRSGDIVASLGIPEMMVLLSDNPDLSWMPLPWAATVVESALRDDSLGRFPHYTRAVAGVFFNEHWLGIP